MLATHPLTYLMTKYSTYIGTTYLIHGYAPLTHMVHTLPGEKKFHNRQMTFQNLPWPAARVEMDSVLYGNYYMTTSPQETFVCIINVL